MGAVAEGDAQIARQAHNARQQADWAADRFAETLAERQKQVTSIENHLDRLDSMIDEQASLYEQLNEDRKDYLAYVEAQRAALEQARQQTSQGPPPSDTTGDTGGSTGGSGGGGGYTPPVNGSAAQTAVSAALSVVGTGYVWGSADPSVGFDCSGLTSWAWAQAGVYIPHSSASQYSSLPHVALGSVQPGDLIFYYSPISHVALYIGGGQSSTHGTRDRAVRCRCNRCTATTTRSARPVRASRGLRAELGLLHQRVVPDPRAASSACIRRAFACRRRASVFSAVAYFSFSSAFTISSKISFGCVGNSSPSPMLGPYRVPPGPFHPSQERSQRHR